MYYGCEMFLSVSFFFLVGNSYVCAMCLFVLFCFCFINFVPCVCFSFFLSFVNIGRRDEVEFLSRSWN